MEFGCDLTALAPPDAAIERWGDVPAVSEGYAAARDAMTARLHRLLAEGLQGAEPRKAS